MPDVLTMAGVVKTFGRTTALDSLDLRVRQGEVHGFLGPNGAGKSTAIRVLLGLLRPDAGRTVLLGGDPWHDAVSLHRRLAYVPGDVTLWPGLTGGETIDLLARLRGDVDPARRADLLERFELDPTKKARAYSKGNRQKVALVAALASRAELLVLDEPTSGLDPLMEAVFTACVREARDEGRTVLLSSHILAEVEALADRVSIIRAGRVVEEGTLDDLRHLTRTSVSAHVRRAPDGLVELDGLHGLHVVDEGAAGHRVEGEVDTDRLDGLLRHLTTLGVKSLTSRPPTLEELFMRHYGEQRPAGRRPGRSPVSTTVGTRTDPAPVHDGRPERGSTATGTWPLLRFALRRDRVRLPLWVLGTASLVVVQADQSQTLYGTADALAGYAETAQTSSALVAMTGRPVGLTSVDRAAVFEVFLTMAVVVALMSVFLVVRHTRADEEAGRAELVRATRVGRRAPLVAAVALLGLANLAVAVVTAGAAVAAGLGAEGAVLLGASLAGVGLVHGALAAVAAQLTAHARSALALAGALVGLSRAAARGRRRPGGRPVVAVADRLGPGHVPVPPGPVVAAAAVPA